MQSFRYPKLIYVDDWYVNILKKNQSFLVEHEIDEEEREVVNLWNLSASSLDSLDWAVDWQATDDESGYASQ